MQTFVLQDWVVVSGSTNSPLIQTEPNWPDLSPFQDIVAWIDMPEASGSPTLFLETAPSKDDTLFVSMNGATGYPLASATVPVVASLLLGQASTPLATFLRWKIVGPNSAWDAAFRITISANSPGWLVPVTDSPGTFQVPTIGSASAAILLGSK